jgi:saccharopine dehydrogenase-like NADP-dependent oxidoreductase
VTAAPLDVAVLGAGGTIAPAIVRDLAESDEVCSLLLLDLDGTRAAAVASEHGGGKASARGLDGGGQELRAAIAGRDVLVNSASYRVNLDAMRACLDAGCNYLDLGGLYWMTARQLELDEDFQQAGLLALLGMGASPGKTNVMAAHAVELLGEEPRSIDIVAAGRDLEPPSGGELSVPYALRTLVDEVTMAPVVVRDGAPVELEPLADGGAVKLPDPIGSAHTIHTIHSEMRTFPASFGCRAASFRLSLAQEVLDRVRDLAGRPDGTIDAAAAKTRGPSGNTVAVHRVEVAGDTRSASVTAVTRPVERWGLGGGIVSTATPAAAAVRLLARGRIDALGALPPERCVPAADLFPELEARGCEFQIESPEVAHA